MAIESNNVYFMRRGWMEHPMFDPEPFTQREAWEWIIASAVWSDMEITVKGNPLILKRGQLSFSIRFLAEKFQWTEKRVRCFLKKLVIWGFIGTEKGAAQTLITVCNYDKYQLTPNTLGASKGNSGAQEGQEKGAKKNSKPIQNKIDLFGPPPESPKRPKPETGPTLEELSVAHIADWLSKKRREGLHQTADENALLEKFKNYCLSKGVVYKDYPAAFRNAFTWDNVPQKSNKYIIP